MKELVKKNIVLFVIFALIANQTVFSQSEPTDDYTTQDRITMGALNMFFGLGSLLHGHKSGWLIMGLETTGIILIVGGSLDKFGSSERKTTWDSKGIHTENVYTEEENKIAPEMRKKLIITGSLVIGGAVVLGYLIPFLYHKPESSKVSENNFPFDIGLATARDGTINGARICYTIEY